MNGRWAPGTILAFGAGGTAVTLALAVQVGLIAGLGMFVTLLALSRAVTL